MAWKFNPFTGNLDYYELNSGGGSPTGAAGGELSGTYPNPALLNSAVLSKVLTGLTITGTTILATDTILQAFGKVQSQLNSFVGGVKYTGTYNASTNTPTLVDGTGTQGNYYVVTTAGTRNFGSGNIDFNIGDWVIYNGTIWQKVDNTDTVTSVNSQTPVAGNITLTTANISEVTNLYFTTARVLATQLTGYVSGAGTVSATDTVLQAIQKLNGNINAILGLTDGNKGDITVASSGTVWTINNNVVTNADLAQAAANTIKGNNTAALSNTTDIALTVKTILGRNAANIAALPFDTFIERLSGTTANRSVVYPTPLIGQLYSNTTTGRLEWYDGTTWRSLPFAQILLTEIQNIQNNRFLGNLSGIAAPPQEIAGLDIWDSVQQSYTYNIASINEWVDTTLFTQTASQTVANTVTETSLLGTGQGTLILPVSFFVVGKTLRGNIKGFMGDDAVPPTIRIQVKLNATTILDTTATTLLAITGSRRFELEFELTNRTTGVSGTIFSQGLFKYFRDNTSEEKICLLNTATNTVNTTIAQTLSVTVTWGTANTNNTITSTNFNLTKLA